MQTAKILGWPGKDPYQAPIFKLPKTVQAEVRKIPAQKRWFDWRSTKFLVTVREFGQHVEGTEEWCVEIDDEESLNKFLTHIEKSAEHVGDFFNKIRNDLA